MSAPIDTPHNINIYVQHTEKVVEPPKTQSGNDSSFQTSIGLENKNTSKDKIKGDSRKKKKEKNNKRGLKEKIKQNEYYADKNNDEISLNDSDDVNTNRAILGQKLDLSA